MVCVEQNYTSLCKIHTLPKKPRCAIIDHADVQNTKTGKKKRKVKLLLSSLNVAFFIVLSVCGEYCYADRYADVIESDAVWVLNVNDQCPT